MEEEKKRPRRILVVDDETPLVELMTDCLIERGYKVLSAADGITAVQMAHREKPDLIVLDVKMPGGSGISVYEDLQRLSDTTYIPVIFITAYANEDLKEKLRRKGARTILFKPFKMEDLLANIRAEIG